MRGSRLKAAHRQPSSSRRLNQSMADPVHPLSSCLCVRSQQTVMVQPKDINTKLRGWAGGAISHQNKHNVKQQQQGRYYGAAIPSQLPHAIPSAGGERGVVNQQSSQARYESLSAPPFVLVSKIRKPLLKGYGGTRNTPFIMVATATAGSETKPGAGHCSHAGLKTFMVECNPDMTLRPHLTHIKEAEPEMTIIQTVREGGEDERRTTNNR
ncbi:hypothetical protein SRHO_G00082440 [Serrasalmus rhombeus]